MRASSSRMLVIATLLAAGIAHAGPAEDAEALNAEGKRLFDARDYTGAVERFRRAWETAPESRYAYNLAAALDDIGRHAEAIDAYEAHLAHADTALDGATAVWARKRLEVLAPKVGRVRIVTGRAEATFEVAGRRREGTAGVLALRADPGTIVVVIRAGTDELVVPVEVTAGEARELDVTAKLAPPPPPPPPEPPPPRVVPIPERPRPAPAPVFFDRWGLVLGGAAIVSAGVGVYLWRASASDYDALADAPDLPTHDARLADARGLRRGAQVGFAVGGALALGAIARYAWVATHPPVTSVTVASTPGGAAVSIGGAW